MRLQHRLHGLCVFGADMQGFNIGKLSKTIKTVLNVLLELLLDILEVLL